MFKFLSSRNQWNRWAYSGYISGIFQAKFRHISDISKAYLRHILGIFQVYLRHNLGINQAYLKHIISISQVKSQTFSAIYQAYHDQVYRCHKHEKSGIIDFTYFKYNSSISQAYLRNISGISIYNPYTSLLSHRIIIFVLVCCTVWY